MPTVRQSTSMRKIIHALLWRTIDPPDIIIDGSGGCVPLKRAARYITTTSRRVWQVGSPIGGAQGGTQGGTMILGIEHTALSVPDIDRAIAFYCDVLGFTLEWKAGWDKGAKPLDDLVGFANSAAKVA